LTLNRIYFFIMVALMALAFNPPYFIELFELKVFDLFTRYSAPYQPDPRILIVGIDQKSLDTHGRWPWPRDVIGQLITRLAGFNAKVVALDITFSTQADKEAKDILGGVSVIAEKTSLREKAPDFVEELEKLKKASSRDEALAAAIKNAGNVVTGFLFHGKDEAAYAAETEEIKFPLIKPFRIKQVQRDRASKDAHIWFTVSGAEPNIPIIQEAGVSAGFLNTWIEKDGVIRSHPLVMEHKGEFFPSLALSAALMYSGASQNSQVIFRDGMFAGAMSGDEFIPADPYGRALLSYLGPDGAFPIISAADVMAKPLDDTAMRKRIEGKIIFIGATATQLYDLRVTPFGYTAGVEVQATAAANALSGGAISKMGWQNIYDIILTGVIGILLLFTLRRVGIIPGLTLTGLLFVSLWVFNYYMFTTAKLWLNVVTPGLMIITGFITVTTHQYIVEQKSRRFIKDAFGRYLSPKVINMIIENPGLLKLGGEKRVMTAYFSDVAGFTTVSEKLQPTELVLLLNEYLSAMSDIIHQFDGTVDKYEGDAIIAFWGAPIIAENHAELCVRAAVTMQRKLGVMRENWRKQGKDELNVRMGINTGPMVVGNMGSRDRMDYTMMGDSVNLAARLEGVNKYYGSLILVSEFTHGHVKDLFLCRELDMVRVQGKKDAIRLFEVVDTMEDSTESQRVFAQAFAHALKTFRAMDFTKAGELFSYCDRLKRGGDGACKLYLKRCAELIESPPAPDWDRVYDMAK
jgi:adenylate cyclase